MAEQMATPGTRIIAKTQKGQIEVEVKNVKPFWYYDTIVFPANQEIPTEVRFFQIPKGQNGKDEIDTNVLQYGTLPAGWRLLIYTIRFAPVYGTLEDVKKLLANSILELEIGGTQRPFAAPSWVFTQGGGPTGAVAIDGAQSEKTLEIVTNGVPSPQAVMKLPYSIEITGGETFNLIMKVKPNVVPAAELKVQAVLDCIAYEPVRGT